MNNLANISFTRRSLMAGAMLGLLGSFSDGAVVTWGTPQAITGDSNVSTDGTLVRAFNVGDAGVASATVNGVLFEGFALSTGVTSGSNGDFSMAVVDVGFNFLSGNTFFGPIVLPTPPFSNLSPAYQTILGAATSTAQPARFDLTMSGLAVGQEYQFQWWVNFSSDPGPVSTLHSASAGNSVTLSDNPSALEGGLGQYVTGTFVADATSQVIRFAPVPPSGSGASAQLNAFQLRQVPEPTSIGLLGTALVTLSFRTRLRRRN